MVMWDSGGDKSWTINGIIIIFQLFYDLSFLFRVKEVISVAMCCCISAPKLEWFTMAEISLIQF